MSAATDIATAFKSRARAQRASRIQASLLRGMGGDLEMGGPTVAILREVIDRSGRNGRILLIDDLPTKLAAAAHFIALEGGTELTDLYPSAGGGGSLHEVWPVARETMAADPDRFIQRMLRPSRRSDPARAAMLLTALAHVGAGNPTPVRLFDVGAGAGLVLPVESYKQSVYGETVGDPDSPVDLGHVWVSPPEVAYDAVPPIVDRQAADPSPLHPANPLHVREMIAWTGPDAPDEIDRITRACEFVAHLGLTIDTAPSSIWLPRGISWPRADAQTVVWHSDVVMEMSVPERTEFATELLAAAGRATDTAPLTVIAFEPVGTDFLLYQDPVGAALRRGEIGIEPNRFELRVSQWPQATTRVLAYADHNGYNAYWNVG